MSVLDKDFYHPNNNVDQPLKDQWPYNSDELLICVDVECHCVNETTEELKNRLVLKKRRVCEVGLTILDTSDIKDIASGDRVQNAWPYLRSFSLAIEENVHDKTGEHREWCKVGCPQDFLFGETQWISKQNFRDTFVRLVNRFHVRSVCGTVNGVSTPVTTSHSDTSKVPPSSNERNIVFLMFGVSNDKRWLQSLDLDLEVEFPNCTIENIQQSAIAKMLEIHLNKQLVGAADLFSYLGIATSKTHNGGNDAVYEMQAFLAPFAMTSRQWSKICTNHKLQILPAIWEAGNGGMSKTNRVVDGLVREF